MGNGQAWTATNAPDQKERIFSRFPPFFQPEVDAGGGGNGAAYVTRTRDPRITKTSAIQVIGHVLRNTTLLRELWNPQFSVRRFDLHRKRTGCSFQRQQFRPRRSRASASRQSTP